MSPENLPSTTSGPGGPVRLVTLPGQRSFWRLWYGLWGGALGVVAGTAVAAAVSALDVDPNEFNPVWLLPGLAIGVMFAVWGLLLANLRFARYVGEHHPEAGVRLQDGVWWQTETWIPIARLQHLDVRQGPLDRYWGMATLSLHTAGTRDHVLDIQGLPLDQAHALRAALLPHLHAHHE